MVATDRALMAHLLRRAGFGATFQEVEAYCAKGYEATMEELLHPERQPGMEEDVLERYVVDCYRHWVQVYQKLAVAAG